MSKEQINSLLNSLFKSRQNCLLLNISTKNSCDDRCDYPILDRLIPEFSRWIKKMLEPPFLPEHTIVTFVCSSSLQTDVIEVDEMDSFIPKFGQIVYLVRTSRLSGMNIHLLKTTTRFIDVEALNDLSRNHFSCVSFLDFYPWHKEDFVKYLTNITIPKSVAIMDGYNNNAYIEIGTRPKEIQEICEYYTMEHDMQWVYIKDGSLDILCLAELMGLKPTERIVKSKELRENIRIIANYFGLSGYNTWNELLKYFGLDNLTTKHNKYNSPIIIECCFIYTLKELLDKDELLLFNMLIPETGNFLCTHPLLVQYESKSIPGNELENLCVQVGNDFSDYIVKKLKTIIES